ncbi:hypothetical protein PYCCODRAFT_100763 [Trametes coccinea BRFM310]|uniref:Secreted protein n=1 Tax=Trametes coccinea (strain BRFM310) TaxID=1353009 RepID=A0A1Y2ITP2_TRAC3|nr:hypothetical protein PYCCODRAFT_100763 [Trametes coccinea BRFM310]
MLAVGRILMTILIICCALSTKCACLPCCRLAGEDDLRTKRSIDNHSAPRSGKYHSTCTAQPVLHPSKTLC